MKKRVVKKGESAERLRATTLPHNKQGVVLSVGDDLDILKSRFKLYNFFFILFFSGDVELLYKLHRNRDAFGFRVMNVIKNCAIGVREHYEGGTECENARVT